MATETTEGILLKQTPYQDRHQIATLFTPTHGIIRLFSHTSKISPLTRIEVTYRSKSETALPRLVDYKLLDPYLHLRTTYPALEAAGALVQALISTQLDNKASPNLYKLTAHYLSATCTNSAPFIASFRLKLLAHEGLLGLSTTCATCGSDLDTAALIPGETLCPAHAPHWALTFTHDELLTLCTLTSSRSLADIQTHQLPDSLSEKLSHLFDHLTT